MNHHKVLVTTLEPFPFSSKFIILEVGPPRSHLTPVIVNPTRKDNKNATTVSGCIVPDPKV
jgi:hypothetical protein